MGGERRWIYRGYAGERQVDDRGRDIGGETERNRQRRK
jgi:hypothetical protein